jgi:hypothetical protein
MDAEEKGKECSTQMTELGENAVESKRKNQNLK